MGDSERISPKIDVTSPKVDVTSTKVDPSLINKKLEETQFSSATAVHPRNKNLIEKKVYQELARRLEQKPPEPDTTTSSVV